MNAAQHHGPQRRLVTMDDFPKYSRLNGTEQVLLQADLRRVRERGAHQAGVDRAEAIVQPAGDGECVCWPARIGVPEFVARYPGGLFTALKQENENRRHDRQLRFRLALVEGYCEPADGGLAGAAPVTAARLVDSWQCKAALELAPACPLVVIVDDILFQDVISHGYHGLDKGPFVKVKIREKEYRGVAWITVPGAEPSTLAPLTGRRKHARAAVVSPSAGVEPPGKRPNGVPPGAPVTARQSAPDPPRDTAEGTADPARTTAERPRPRTRRRINVTISVAMVTVVGALVAAVIPSLLSGGGHADPGPTSVSSGGPLPVTTLPSSTPVTTAPTTTTPPTTAPASSPARTWTEIADHRTGVPVFSSPDGATAALRNIPMGTRVPVACWVANTSGMASVNAWYSIAAGPWKGAYAPANTFANGDPVGSNGGTHIIDPEVPQCP